MQPRQISVAAGASSHWVGAVCILPSALTRRKAVFFFSSFELMFNLYTGGVVAT